MRPISFLVLVAALSATLPFANKFFFASGQSTRPALWETYEQALRCAKYVDLTHSIEPGMTVWSGFSTPQFGRTADPKTSRNYSYASDGFEANQYALPTDQLGTQLDPPAHWNADFPAIDELPATFAVRPLVVISIVDRLATDPAYSLQVSDIKEWELRFGRIPKGSVVFVRSDWSRDWGKPGLAERTVFPGVSLEALQFLHLERQILFHGHEPLDTDATPNLDSERWLLTNGYTQAEGLTNLDLVPEAGALVSIGFAKFKGGLGGYARYIAICPSDWQHGISIDESTEAPLKKMPKPLRWDPTNRVRQR